MVISNNGGGSGVVVGGRCAATQGCVRAGDVAVCVCSVYVQVVSCLTAGVHLTFVNVLCALWYPICVVFFVWFSR